jgi:small-conductance mechanosensitive channel
MIDFSSLFSFENLVLIVVSILIILVTIGLERILRNIISKYSIRINLDKHAENILRLSAKVIVYSIGIVALLQYLGVGVEWFLGVSALTGAAIGFASTQTLGNFLAGLYLMVSKPFSIKDYVKIGGVEGSVEEITINYTKLFTPTYNITKIPNRTVLDSTITNYSVNDNIIDYSVEIEFPHRLTITNYEIIEKCIKPEIEKYYEKYSEYLPRIPEYSMSSFNRLGKAFYIRMFFFEDDVKRFFDIQPELVQNISEKWDLYSGKKIDENIS